ncbi:hypothetical protein JVU11DRAFT_7722 [Chiua virens]|nr:hypothetical protein JVU11DRAFT_7722 [Chiua virens]
MSHDNDKTQLVDAHARPQPLTWRFAVLVALLAIFLSLVFYFRPNATPEPTIIYATRSDTRKNSSIAPPPVPSSRSDSKTGEYDCGEQFRRRNFDCVCLSTEVIYTLECSVPFVDHTGFGICIIILVEMDPWGGISGIYDPTDLMMGRTAPQSLSWQESRGEGQRLNLKESEARVRTFQSNRERRARTA